MATSEGDRVSAFFLGFSLGVLFVALVVELSDHNNAPDKICEAVSKGSVWDGKLKLCVHITKDVVSDEGKL